MIEDQLRFLGLKKFGNKNNLRFVGKILENRKSARVRSWKLRIAAEVVKCDM